MQQQDTRSALVPQQSANVPFAPVPPSGLVPLSDELLELVGGGAGPHDNWK